MIIGGWRGLGWRVVDADPDQVRQVRDWIKAAINRHDSPVDPDEAALVISELYTNSVMHGPEGGRGLQVIHAVAAQWDSFRVPGAWPGWCGAISASRCAPRRPTLGPGCTASWPSAL